MRKRGYKTELELNNEQITACLKHAGCARKAYNLGLARKEEARVAGLPMPNARQLHRELNALKATEFPYMYEVSKCAPQEALIDLDNAFTHFFNCPRAPRCFAQSHRWIGSEKQVIRPATDCDCDRGSPCLGHAQEPSFVESNRRCGLV